MQNWNAPEYTDIFDQAEVNFDEKAELAKTIGMALSRRLDQIVIDVVTGATYSTTPANIDTGAEVAAGGTGLTVAKLRAASAFLNDRGVDQGDRYIMHTAADLNSLLGEEETTSSDFNTIKALVQGELNTFMGFTFKLIESRTEGGIPVNETYCWHKSAVGLAIGLDMRTEVYYVPQKTSWLCNGILKAGAVVREAAGLVKINNV